MATGGAVRRGSPSGPKALEKAQLAFAAGTLTSLTTKVITQTLTGVRTTDRVCLNSAAALPTGVVLGDARVSAVDVVSIRFANVTTADVAGGNMTMDAVIMRFSA